MIMDWATFGCPTKTGAPWSQSDIEEAIARGPHQLVLTPKAIEHFTKEIREKVCIQQARVVEWDSIKDNPSMELKILPIAAIPHKLKAYWSILDLSFRLRLKKWRFQGCGKQDNHQNCPGRSH